MPVSVSESNTQANTGKDELICHHCSEPCPDDRIAIEDKLFCCEGCKTVYEILSANNLCRYYDIDENAGVSLRGQSREEYAYLDDPDVQERILDFSDGQQSKVRFFLPQIHCASCIWLLENLYKLNEGITDSRVNFLKKEIFLTFRPAEVSLRKVVELLAKLGYAPAINLSNLEDEKKPVVNRSFFFRLGVAGFAFGNIMLLSFPEYLGLDQSMEREFFQLFGYLNILLALPVVFYSGWGYLRSAFQGLKQRDLNIDVPISLGILTLFGRSLYEILSHSGAGYLDSLAGLVFFLLIGRWFQQRTYHNISFERDYKSYFPIAARRKTGEEVQSASLDKLKAGDRIIIKNRELIPADSVLLRGTAEIDYSFVTGESQPVHLPEGEKIYAGGRQMGDTIEVSLTKPVSQSYLTQLWNDEAFTKKQASNASRLANRVGRYFTIAILLVAGATLLFWLPRNVATGVNAFTAVLIIACPCAVALAIPFIFGNVLRILGRHEFYLKNTNVIEALAAVNTVVFDKTGTLTQRGTGKTGFVGAPLSGEEMQLLGALTAPSTHPVSQRIFEWLQKDGQAPSSERLPAPHNWQETVGRGVQATVGGRDMRLGAPGFMNGAAGDAALEPSGVYLQIDGRLRGYFQLDQSFRPGLRRVMDFFRGLGPNYLLSGDNDRERPLLAPYFSQADKLRFRQSPRDKLNFIKERQGTGHQVLMLGDGLNDAGALQQSDAGIVLTENTNNFTPACDGVLHARHFDRLPQFLQFSRRSIRLVYGAYLFALMYNVIGLSFAVQGALSPIVAAILMPLSSISIVLFGMLTSNLLAKRMGL